MILSGKSLRPAICLIYGLIILLISNCERLDYFERVLKFSNLSNYTVGVHEAYIQDEFTDIGELPILDHGHCWAPHEMPEIRDACTHLGSIDQAGTFGSNLYDLGANETYFVRAYARTKEDTFYNAQGSFTTWGVIDWEGNSYPTVVIGEQEWMAVNLRTRYYESGADLVDGNHAGNIEFDFTTQYFFTQDIEEELVGVYGRLYTWAAVMDGAASSGEIPSGVQGVCPVGWHVPSDAEWMDLEIYIGMTPSETEAMGDRGNQGGKLKSHDYFWPPNTGATNEFGFSAVPGGDRWAAGGYNLPGGHGSYWTSTQVDPQTAIIRGFEYNKSSITKWNHLMDYGFSVRCVKD